jgi:dienelactone hydrolase
MSLTYESHAVLDFEGEPDRVIRMRVEGPAGYLERAERLPYVLLLHGFKGFMHWGFFPELSRRVARAGLVAVSFNFSGSGVGERQEEFTEEEAFARNTYSRELEDVARVGRHVASGVLAGVDPARGAIVGHSRGGGIALLHAAEVGDYRSLVTWSAIDEVDRFDDQLKNQ